MSKFKIIDLFVLTSVSAILVAIARIAPEVFFGLFFLSVVILTFSSVTTVLFALLCGKQTGTMIDPKTIPLFYALGRIWKYSAIGTVLTFAGIALSFAII